jgi:hypothetical protein
MKIERVSNGFILTQDSYYLDGELVREEKEVFEVDGDDVKCLTAVVNMLYSILEWSGNSGSKHDKYRIRITLEEQCQ